MVETTVATGRVGMDPATAGALADFRRFNYEDIYLRPASVAQARIVDRLLGELVEWYRVDPTRLRLAGRAVDDDVDPTHEAVAFVGGMTDRYALDRALEHLGWQTDDLPIGLTA